MRSVIGVIAGIVAGLMALMLVAFIGGQFYTVPVGIDARDPEQLAAAVASLPDGIKFVLLLAWLASGLVGGLVAKAIGGRDLPVWIVAGLFALVVLLNVLILPMPVWMQIVAVAGPLIGGMIATHLIARRSPPAQEGAATDAV